MPPKQGIESLTSSFSASTDNLFYMGLQNNPDANMNNVRPLDVTDFCTNKTFHVPNVEVPKESVQSAGLSGFDSAGVRANVEAVKQDYVGTDNTIKNYCTQVAKSMFGANEGNKMMGQILPEAPSTHKQAAGNLVMQAIDPLQGGAAVLASVATAVTGEMGKFKDPEIIAKLDEMLTKIREAGDAGNKAMLSMTNDVEIPSIPDGIDFNNITGAELFAFLKRDIGNDRIMQEIEEVEVALDEYDANLAFKEEFDHQVVTTAKLEQEIREGDMEALAEFTGGDIAAAEDVMEYGPDAVDLVCSGLEAPGRVSCNISPEFESFHTIQAALAEMGNKSAGPAMDNENALRMAAKAFQPSDSSMMG